MLIKSKKLLSATSLLLASTASMAESSVDILLVKISTYQDLIVIAAYAIGAIILLNCFFSLKKLSEPNSQETPGEIAIKFLIAFVLLAFGFFMSSIGASF